MSRTSFGAKWTRDVSSRRSKTDHYTHKKNLREKGKRQKRRVAAKKKKKDEEKGHKKVIHLSSPQTSTSIHRAFKLLHSEHSRSSIPSTYAHQRFQTLKRSSMIPSYYAHQRSRTVTLLRSEHLCLSIQSTNVGQLRALPNVIQPGLQSPSNKELGILNLDLRNWIEFRVFMHGLLTQNSRAKWIQEFNWNIWGKSLIIQYLKVEV